MTDKLASHIIKLGTYEATLLLGKCNAFGQGQFLVITVRVLTMIPSTTTRPQAMTHQEIKDCESIDCIIQRKKSYL
jgi:hypothetical protein